MKEDFREKHKNFSNGESKESKESKDLFDDDLIEELKKVYDPYLEQNYTTDNDDSRANWLFMQKDGGNLLYNYLLKKHLDQFDYGERKVEVENET